MAPPSRREMLRSVSGVSTAIGFGYVFSTTAIAEEGDNNHPNHNPHERSSPDLKIINNRKRKEQDIQSKSDLVQQTKSEEITLNISSAKNKIKGVNKIINTPVTTIESIEIPDKGNNRFNMETSNSSISKEIFIPRKRIPSWMTIVAVLEEDGIDLSLEVV